MRTRLRAAAVVLAAAVLPCVAAAPPEVGDLVVEPGGTLRWSAAPEAADYNVYRGRASRLATDPPRCFADEVGATELATTDLPPAGEAFVYLVTGESAAAEEGTPGSGSAGGTRATYGRCDPVMRHALLSRVTYGWNEWVRDRLAALGREAFLDEQLDPASIDESTNTDLNDRRAPLTPPDNHRELVGLSVVNAVYARRQLEELVTTFWVNHFNTEFRSSAMFFNSRQEIPVEERVRLAAGFHHRETEEFRALAFEGTFREIVEASAKSPAMILYLDTIENVAGRPNENYARELLELHTMGVAGGYTQQDIVELARVLTGWNVCKKTAASAGDPLAPCIPRPLESTTAGSYVANFRSAQHDTGDKVLFAGTPHETVIAGTPGNPAAGVNDLEIALDAIAAHPATARFLATKLLQVFVADAPSTAQVDDVVAAWTATGGDLRAVLRAVLEQPALADPAAQRAKIRTPLEHVSWALRAARGRTNGLALVRDYLVRMQHVPYANPVPTGYPERGDVWIDTNNTLERQNFGMDMTARSAASFGSDPIGLMGTAGLTVNSPPDAIVDFWSDVLHGGAISPADRQEAIDYLSTDDDGVIDPNLTETRVREVVGFLIGYPAGQEQ